MSKDKSNIPAFWDTEGHQAAIAHRGGDAVGGDKENSLAAFEAAHRLGYRYFETDVVPTKEGHLLAIHGRGYQLHPNPDLPTRMRIQGMTLEEAKKEIKVGGFAPVLLEELLTTFPDGYWFIDPKVASAVKPLAELLKSGVIDLDHVSVGAFTQERTSKVAQEVKESTSRDICTSIGPIGAFALLGASDTPRKNLEFRDRQILTLLETTHRLPNPSHIVEATGATSLNVPYRWLTPGGNLVEIAHECGLHAVVGWTPDSRSAIADTWDSGASVMSNNLLGLRSLAMERDPNNPTLHLPKLAVLSGRQGVSNKESSQEEQDFEEEPFVFEGVPRRLMPRFERKARSIANSIFQSAEQGHMVFVPEVSLLPLRLTGQTVNHHPTEYKRAAQFLAQKGIKFQTFHIFDERTKQPSDLVVITEYDGKPVVESEELSPHLKQKDLGDFWGNGGWVDPLRGPAEGWSSLARPSKTAEKD